MDQVIERIKKMGVVPVVAIENAADAPELGKALLAGGLPCAEITFRTRAAAEAIRLMAQNCPPRTTMLSLWVGIPNSYRTGWLSMVGTPTTAMVKPPGSIWKHIMVGRLRMEEKIAPNLTS